MSKSKTRFKQGVNSSSVAWVRPRVIGIRIFVYSTRVEVTVYRHGSMFAERTYKAPTMASLLRVIRVGRAQAGQTNEVYQSA